MSDETTRATGNNFSGKRSRILREAFDKKIKTYNDAKIVHKKVVETLKANKRPDLDNVKNNESCNDDHYNVHDKNINANKNEDSTILENNNNSSQQEETSNSSNNNVVQNEEQEEALILDDNEFLNNRDKELNESNLSDDTDDDSGDDASDNSSDDNNGDNTEDSDDDTTDEDDPEFRDKYKEIFEANKQKLSNKAKQAVEEDEKEMVSIIKSFKSKKIKSSKKSLDLKKFRNTVKEETLELRK